MCCGSLLGPSIISVYVVLSEDYGSSGPRMKVYMTTRPIPLLLLLDCPEPAGVNLNYVAHPQGRLSSQPGLPNPMRLLASHIELVLRSTVGTIDLAAWPTPNCTRTNIEQYEAGYWCTNIDLYGRPLCGSRLGELPPVTDLGLIELRSMSVLYTSAGPPPPSTGATQRHEGQSRLRVRKAGAPIRSYRWHEHDGRGRPLRTATGEG